MYSGKRSCKHFQYPTLKDLASVVILRDTSKSNCSVGHMSILSDLCCKTVRLITATQTSQLDTNLVSIELDYLICSQWTSLTSFAGCINGINVNIELGTRNFFAISSSLGKAKNYLYQCYFVPYKNCIVSFFNRTTMFSWL